ncbi:MAG TPA: FAD-binding oxidoreductase [Mycobacteriales bacterium]
MTTPRIGVVGAGIAGSLLAWRLAMKDPDRRIELLGAPAPHGDATGVSGGLVRTFETDPASRALATESLAELLANPTLRAWSEYRPIGSVYLVSPSDHPAIAAATGLAESAGLAGSAGATDRVGTAGISVRDAAGLAAEYGWCGLPEGSLGVVETLAGNISPDSLRGRILDDLVNRGVPVRREPVTELWCEPDGGVTVRTSTRAHRFDAVVVAVGRWTARLLRNSGLPDEGYRVKLVQYGVYEAFGPPPPAFVDDTSGLYGRGRVNGQVLLGIPVHRFDIAPDSPQPDLDAQCRATELAEQRLPGLRLGRLLRVVAGADCYTEPAGLRLREVPGPPGRIFTFTGGSGGSAKLALAASARAADQLAALLHTDPPTRRRTPARST